MKFFGALIIGLSAWLGWASYMRMRGGSPDNAFGSVLGGLAGSKGATSIPAPQVIPNFSDDLNPVV